MSKPIDILKEKVGLNILKQLEEKISPVIEIPKRTKNNVFFDEKEQILKMMDGKIIRKMNDLSGIRNFTQTIVVTKIIHDILKRNITIRKRDIYYTGRKLEVGKKRFFKEQSECNNIIEDVETITGLLREEMNITTEISGLLKGYLVFESLNKKGKWLKTDCVESSDPVPITNRFMTKDKFRIVSVDANFVLVIEKGGILERLIDLDFEEKHNCILISTRGQPDRASRFFVKMLNHKYNLPVYILTDGDPWGHHIASVWKYGSIKLCYESERLACPKAKFIGILPSDFKKYKITDLEPFTKEDLKKSKKMLENEWLKYEDEWKKELELFMKIKKKCEIENLSSHDFAFIADTYLPEKLGLKH